MTAPQLTAAALVAKGKATADEIAVKAGVSRRTIQSWKKDKEFQAEVHREKNAWREKARTQGTSDQDFRLRALNDRHTRLRALMVERGKDPTMQHVPGWKTGLLKATFKMQHMGGDKESTRVDEYQVDSAMLDSFLAIEEHVAIQTGQWRPKVVNEGEVSINIIMAKINAGRQRVAEAKIADDLKLLAASS